MQIGGTLMKVIVMVLLVAVLGYVILPRMWDYGKIVLGWGDDDNIKEVDPNLVSILRVEPTGEILNYKNYALWEGSGETVKQQGGFATLNLVFDKDLNPQQIMDAIEVYQEKCSGYDVTSDPTGMGNVVDTCSGIPKGQNEYWLMENRPVQYVIGYLTPESKKKFFFQVQGYDSQDYIIKFKKDYIEGYCGDTCKGLDEKGHRLNPNTVMIRFTT